MSSDSSSGGHGVNSAIIPLAVLCSGLIVGGIAAIIITRKIARIRLLRQIMLAEQEAAAEEEFMGRKPVLTDIYVGPPPIHHSPDADRSLTHHRHHSSWFDLQVSHV